MKKYFLTIISCMLLFTSCQRGGNGILIEAENFSNTGGWVNDNQSMMQMGSPYLLAHGMGVPVADAETSFEVGKAGVYRVWVRTRDWVKSFGRTGAPGRFEVAVNGSTLGTVFGTESEEWNWQDGGTVGLPQGTSTLTLHDLTGFEGRCDAIYLTMDLEGGAPTNEPRALERLRRATLGLGKPQDAGEYDLVVVGGGAGGCCAAVSAARLGCKVALIQNRPVLGGNNSSEVRVGMTGFVRREPYTNLGALMDELGGAMDVLLVEARMDADTARLAVLQSIMDKHPEKWISNAGPASNYEDEKKLNLIRNEKNITLFLNTQAVGVKMDGSRIKEVVGKNIVTGEEYLFRGSLFADCTGDANLGYMAGADYRMGRESRSETGEPLAPEQADSLVMGTSVMWYAKEDGVQSSFPECPWAIQFCDTTCQPMLHGDWYWESGLDRDQVDEVEHIRDHGLRAIYGNWSYLKNHYTGKSEYATKSLEWVAYIGGKRESRRLMGDVVIREQDVRDRKVFDDAAVITNWGMDLHYPKPIPGVDDEPFQAISISTGHQPYFIPYRCLYSRNVDNLFMAGRNISVTHVTLGTVRVQRTIGVMGEVVGMAASICREHSTTPRGVYEQYLPQLKELMMKGTGRKGF